MENRKATEAGQDITMQKEDFAALWKTIHLKVTDTYEVPPEILWVNGSTIYQRIRSYELSEFTKDHQKEIMKEIS